MAKESMIVETIEALEVAISVMTRPDKEDYISLTDIARHRNRDDPSGVVANWMRNRNTVEYLGLWEILNNPEFKPLEFEGFREAAGGNAFTLSNSLLITQGKPQRERMISLRSMAISQLERITGIKSITELHRLDDQLRLPDASSQ